MKAAQRRFSWELLALFLVTVLVFATTLRFEFLNYDDPRVVTANPLVQELSWANLWRIVSGQLHGDYQPLYLLTYVVEWQLSGGAPWLFHTTNTLLHGVSAVLLAQVLEPVLGRRRSIAAALLFGVHPLTVEPVAWIASRKDVLMLPLLLGAVLAYRRATAPERLQGKSVIAALLLGLGAVLSKASGVVLPGLLVLDRLSAGERRLDLRREWGPLGIFSLLAALGVGLKLLAFQQAGAAATIPPEGLLARGELVLLTLGTFLRHTLAPLGLQLGYDADLSGLERVTTLGGLLVACGVVWALRRRRGVLYGVGWWVLALVPVMQLMPFHIWAADRYAYAALPGACCVVATLILPERAMRERKVAFAIALGVACWLTQRQLPMWSDSQTLWTTHVALNPQHRVAVPNLARVLWASGERAAARRLLEQAWREQPDNHRVGRLYGELLAAEGDLAGAEAVLRDQGPSGVKARVLIALGHRAEGLEVLEGALAERSNDHDLRVLRASLRMEDGAFAAARDDLECALGADPSQARTWVLLARARARVGDPAGAKAAMGRAKALGLEAGALEALLRSDSTLREAVGR